MQCENNLALGAIILGLRRSGTIDKRTVQLIVQALEETAAKARPHCIDAADGLNKLADWLSTGAGRTRLVNLEA